ncbi:regulator of DNA class I crossover intermediates 1 isoform X2 [Erythrolamprus reginae]|uniref:regulator of DNA class I crossover intermediates 1 isoform X2 n=1 Tax=Erythrolamprus reginae TaxID=121349 RepID=UPI00396C3E92
MTSSTGYKKKSWIVEENTSMKKPVFILNPGHGNSIDKDSGNHQANVEESLYGTLNDQITSQDATFQPVASLFEEENQFLTFPPSQSYCSFANQSHIDQLFGDFGDAKEIFSKPSLSDSEEMHQMTGPAHCAAERDLASILTAPEMICSLNNRSLNAINQNPVRFKPCSIQNRNSTDFPDQQNLTTFFDNIGGFTNQKKHTKAPKPITGLLKYSRNKGHPDLDVDYLKIFKHETLNKEVYSDFDQHWKQSRQNDDDSQLSNQSPTYSPEQAGRYASSSSDESKPEERSEGASSDSQGSFSRTSRHLCSGLGGCGRSEYVCQFDGRHWNTTNLQSQARSPRTPGKNTLHRGGLPLSDLNGKEKHEASSQTDACAEPVEKSNAAVQCDIIQNCHCKTEPSFARRVETVISTSEVETTGGQNTPADSAVLQPPNSNALSTKNLSPETDSFIVVGSA